MFKWLSRDKNTKRIDAHGVVLSVVFTADGKHIVSGGEEKKIRRWRATDGKEEGMPIDAGSNILSIAVSRDSKRIVSGTRSGKVMVWGTESGKLEKTMELSTHNNQVFAVDISPSGTRIVTGSDDNTVCVWSTSTGERLLGPLDLDGDVAVVKFSPDGLLIATATWRRDFVRIYDSQHGDLLVDFQISVKSYFNESLAWSSDKHIFALSRDGNANHVDVSTGTTLSRWRIHGSSDSMCIALATNVLFIAVSDESSVSFWDTTTHEQIGPVIQHTYAIWSMALSANFDLAVTGDNKISLFHLRLILPSHYVNIVSEPEKQALQPEERSTGSHALLNLIHANDTTLDLWRRDKLLGAMHSLSQHKRKSKGERYHLLATRAFLRARLRQWAPAILDAQKSITIQPNILAYFALGIARFGQGNVKSGKEAFHWLLYKCDVEGIISFIFLVKAIVMFIFGHREESMIRVEELVSGSLEHERIACRAVQIHMSLNEAKARISRQEYKKALELLTKLRDIQISNNLQVECISLMFGWTFDSDVLSFMCYQQRCEALYALGRQNEAAAQLDAASDHLERQSDSRDQDKKWLQDFTRRLVLYE